LKNQDIAVSSESEKSFFADISRILNEGRHKVHTAVNFTMVETYWNIGKEFSEANLKNFRQFYLT